ncbi:MAG: hydroxymyristoyl-ACP dehydratase [Bacteroidota bacterium]
MNSDKIIQKLPYAPPFLFVDQLVHIDADGVVGQYTFHKDSYFYKGHFKDHPITPGALLTECCAQIGVVCLGIYLYGETVISKPAIALTSTAMEFLLPVEPGETVTVHAEKIYFRFQKLKCKVKMTNAGNQLVCKGEVAGMLTRFAGEK